MPREVQNQQASMNIHTCNKPVVPVINVTIIPKHGTAGTATTRVAHQYNVERPEGETGRVEESGSGSIKFLMVSARTLKTYCLKT